MSAQPNTPATRRVMSRMRRFFTRHVPFTIAGALVLIIVTSVGAYFYLSSAHFENVMRGRMVRNLEASPAGALRSNHSTGICSISKPTSAASSSTALKRPAKHPTRVSIIFTWHSASSTS